MAEKSHSVHWMLSRKENLTKLGSRRLLGGPSDNRRLHWWSARQLVALPCHKQRLRELEKEGRHLGAETK